MLGAGDTITISGSSTNPTLTVQTPSGGGIPVLPRFENFRDVKFGTENISLVITEIGSDLELGEYQRLGQFHYKGIDLQSDSGHPTPKETGGRKAILLVSARKESSSRAIGYIEIQMPLLMCKPRHDFFSRPFTSKAAKIKWNTWLGDGQKYVNRIARIARVVVDPEFRGVGISSILVEEAKKFCAERWHIGGERPLFIEISAEMLRYIDFVTRAGLHFVGNTEGNLNRISKDLRSIQNGAGGKSGIMSLQRKYHTAFTTYCEKTGSSFDEARLILSDLLRYKDPRSEMASDEWLAFRPILRFPIPYYLGGLDKESDEYIRNGVLENSREVRLATIAPDSAHKIGSTVDHIEYNDLNVSVNYDIPLSPYVRLIMDSFGIETSKISNRVVGPVNISLSRGSISLITGASGAGKSILLQSLSSDCMPPGVVKSYSGDTDSLKTCTLSELPCGIPIFQYFADLYGPEKTFDALCHVGLSEAMVFIKPFELLSMGQRYRAMFANLILGDADVWLIDEFCSNLDPITSKILSIRLKKLAQRMGRFVAVASANTSHFIDALNPDSIYVVRIGGSVTKMNLREYRNGFFDKGF